MNESQYKMTAKSRYQPSKTVEALFTAAVVKIKAGADKAIAEQKARSEAEEVATITKVEAEVKEPIVAQKIESEVETEAATEEKAAIEPETESVEQTATNETKSEAETEEALVESKAEEKIEGEAVEAHIQSQEELQEAEPDSQKETEETRESEAEQEVKAEEAEQKTEGADADASEDVAEEKVEITAESQEPAAGEVSKTIQQMTQSQPNQLKDELLAASDLCAKNVMQREFVWGSPEDSVQQTLTKMQQHDIRYILIGQNGVLEGLVSKSDLTGGISPYLRPVFAKWRRPLDDATLQIRVKWIMSRPVHIAKPETPLANVMGNMCRFGVLCLPVVDQQGKVQGLVTEADIFKVLLELENSPNISASGNEHKEQSTSDHREIESTPTMEPDLVAPV